MAFTTTAPLYQRNAVSSAVSRKASPVGRTALLGNTARLSLPSQPKYVQSRRAVSFVKAANDTQTTEAEDAAAIKQFSENIGLPVEEGIFGFKPFAEVWVGRLAMAGFLSSILVEFTTGRGTLQQVGLVTPSLPLFATILALAGTATTIASWSTILRATSNKMTANELVRYRQFLGIQNEDKNIAETRSRGTPADRVLGPNDDETNEQSVKGASAEASNSDSQSSGAKFTKDDLVTQKQFANEGLAYARDVEVNNGRWAMIGFLAALLVEAGTGRGILGQVILYLKFVGLLGKDSGF